MGPAVSTLIHDVSTMLFDRNFSQDDVTQQLPLFHSAKFPYISLNESPSYSDEPSMSSSIIQTPLVKEDATLYKQNVSEIASKIIPKRAWSGYHLFQLANMKGDPSQPPRIIKTPRFRSTGHKLASNLNTVNSSAPSLSSTTSQQTKPLLIIENTIDTEKGKEPAEMEQLISMMKNHKVSDDTASFDFNFGLNNNNKPLTPIPSPQSATTSFIPSPEFKFSFSASIPNTNHHYTYGYSTNTTIPNEEEDEYDDDEGTENHLNNDTLYISERKILPLPKPRWKRHQDKSTTTIAIRTQDGSTNYPFNRVQDANNTSHLFNRIPSSNITLNEDMSNIKKMKCSAGNKVISNKQRQKVDNKRKERNWQDNVSSSSTTAEVTEIPI
ncbi:uncharacterized protein BX663DRAFT_44421 [Cokeromyces recurvatus]|uniref:uncharacterized protein n=1 Tax=Cokeromyces recurvatus TaxID=90255 RepID=UPI00221FDD60|nr:uncharacterized protein BX663DRAFT_44421 [Cokeromyces recurvatus]KAI7903222.1 hypothetical protein BX663DRAFT_44421 [Cokeromyces recurvatus]